MSTAIISVIDGLLLKYEAQRWSQPRKRVADKSSDRKSCVARIRRARARPTKRGCASYRPSFEKGRRRVPVSLLPVIAQALDTTLDALVNDETHTTAAAPKKRRPAPKIQQQLERINALPKAQQRFVMQMIETALQQQGA